MLSLCGLIIILGKNGYIIIILQTTKLYCNLFPASVISESVNKKICEINIFTPFHMYMFAYVCGVHSHLCMDSCESRRCAIPWTWS